LLEGLIRLDRAAAMPLTEQIYRQIREGVRGGRIGGGLRLPSSRALAGALGVSRNTVTAAYELLQAEGVVSVGRGAAPAVMAPAATPRPAATAAATMHLAERGTRLASDRYDGAYLLGSGAFRPGRPDPALFPRDLWARSLRRATRVLGGDSLLYEHREGLPALRAVLADYLAGSRGVVAMPEQIHVVPSVQSALAMIATCLADPGDNVWIEDPGYLGARAAFAGLALDPLPVDGEGADPTAMKRTPRLIYVTPSHQYPTGARMSLPRRIALLAAARRHRAIVIEDDYDSEFLWQGRPIPALQALGASEVIYLGTVAKSLLPGLRLAYLILPPGLCAAFRPVQSNLGLLANVHAQAAFADFIDGGHYRAHLKRISTVYEGRALTLAAAIRAACGDAVVVPTPQGGLQMTVGFGEAVDDRAVAGALAAEGYGPSILSALCLGARRSGLVVGFAEASAADAARFAAALARALSTARPTRHE